MKIILATSNQGKVREFKEMLNSFELLPFNQVMEPFEIVENGDSFAKNALIKARAIYGKLDKQKKREYIIISDDSGISLPILDNRPGIFSARYARKGASDRENLQKLIDDLKSIGVDRTQAYYTASIAIVSRFGEYVVHGWMYGDVITTPRGDKGFGYDPIFIPDGYNHTLGELDGKIKSDISHRAKAVESIKPILEMLRAKVDR